jgi:hypothetical protein
VKINEIILEVKERSKIRKATQNSVSNLHSYPYLDNNAHPYVAYRFGVALARSPHDVTARQGPIGSQFTTIGYSDVDQEIIDHTREEFGLPVRKLSTKGSFELDGVNKSSPVATTKKNKYGV